MNTYLNAFLTEIDEKFLKDHTFALMQKELPQTNSANHEAADYIYELLKENGFDAERINFVSDGKTVCQDKIMPICWEATYGRLTIMSEWNGDRVIADYEKEPFSLIRCSVETPEEGLTARMITWEQMMNGVDATGAFVTVPQGTLPTDKVLIPILDAGGIGLINGTLWTPDVIPDEVFWANNCTETNSWHVNADERPFIGFSVSPNMLKRLEKAANEGDVILKAETDAHRFAGEMPAVTALLKGESDREFWVIAHTAEPLEDDNNAGVISCIHSLALIKKAISERKIPSLKYSIRVLFSPELYGPAAFAEKFGGVLRKRCIGALNVDGMPICPEHTRMILQFAPPAIPFYGNVLLEAIWDEYKKTVQEVPFPADWFDHWSDDCFMSDTSVGLPTVMPEYIGRTFWHCSYQRGDYVDYAQFARVCAVYTAYIASVAAYDSEILEKTLPKAVVYASNRLAEIASSVPTRPGTDEKKRLAYRLNIEINNIKAFKDAGVNEYAINKACKMLEYFATNLTPVKAPGKSEETPYFDSTSEYIPERITIGVPHDFANAPLSRRWHPVLLNLLSRVFSAMDGKKNLQTLIIEAEWEEKMSWSEEEIADFIDTMKFMAEFGYIKLHKCNPKMRFESDK